MPSVELYNAELDKWTKLALEMPFYHVNFDLALQLSEHEIIILKKWQDMNNPLEMAASHDLGGFYILNI